MKSLVTLLMLFLLPMTGVKSSGVKLTEIPFESLFALDPSTSHLASSALVTLGAIEITGIPGFAAARQSALGDLAACLSLETSENSVQTTVLADGSKKLSTGAKSSNGAAGEMLSGCGKPADKLRSVTQGTVRFLMQALDQTARELETSSHLNYDATSSPLENRFLLEPYKNYLDLVDGGEHLEHLHSYLSPEAGATSERATVGTHSLCTYITVV